MREDAMRRISEAEEDMGTLPIEIPEQLEKSQEDGDGAAYAGSRNAAGEKEGFGIINMWNESVYVGYWRAGKANGKGWFFLAEGDIYKGDWLDDKAHGQG